MTLREDIGDLTRDILYNPPLPEYWNQEINTHVNKLLNLVIEKIDIKLRNVENEQPDYWRGYLDALRELKQEIKK
ncbi:MAG: hypothetical protein R3321_02330 [Nitrososphaeraceae archaeon]|nr:hypothetical protein [Nitrososphaeraceae archaeon]